MNVTLRAEAPLIVPPSVRRRAGLKPGDKIEFQASGGIITITAKPEPEDDEYTPEQRKYTDSRPAIALKEVEQGKVVGPFDTAGEMMVSIESELKRRRAAKRKKRAG
jgi:bifunctional DNA-binding transcriptional regulator/antitoxin component of YhaV-PrlF toxin-antitoxin module